MPETSRNMLPGFTANASISKIHFDNPIEGYNNSYIQRSVLRPAFDQSDIDKIKYCTSMAIIGNFPGHIKHWDEYCQQYD